MSIDFVSTLGVQGPPGPPGSGNTYVQETAPAGGIVDGQQWVQPSTGKVRVWYGGAWQDVTLDGEHF